MNPIDNNLLQKSIRLNKNLCKSLQFRKYFLDPGNAESLNVTLFAFFFKGVNDVNKAFFTLYNSDERNIAYSLIRLQLDNLRLLYAEYLYPTKALSPTFKNNRELNQIKVNGEKLKPSDLTIAIEEKFIGYKALYEKYSKYIHPAKRDYDRYLLLRDVDYNNLSKEEIKARYKELAEEFKRNQEEFYRDSLKDMITINRFILFTFFLIRKHYQTLALKKIGIKEFNELKVQWKDFFRTADIVEMAEEL